MTALTQFDRLESGGLWRENPEAQRRDVTVSFGKTSLVLADGAGRPLTHWSLPAITRINPGTRPALFAPDAEATETLEIADDMMVDAIEKVRKSLTSAAPQPGKLRARILLTLAGVALLGGLFWFPAAFTEKTVSVVPSAKRTEIGATVLGHYQRLTGATCRGEAGTAALAALKNRLIGPDAPGQLVVVQSLPQGAVVLPGGIILLARDIVEDNDDPAITAGYVIAAHARQTAQDPLHALLAQAGISTTMTLFTTSDIPDTALRRYAETLQSSTQSPADGAVLQAAFTAARVPPGPYLATSMAAADMQAAVIDGADIASDPILKDADWVRLQGICMQ